jgi:hypothetical protein
MLIYAAPDPDPQHRIKPIMNFIGDSMVWTQNWKVPCLLKKDATRGIKANEGVGEWGRERG